MGIGRQLLGLSLIALVFAVLWTIERVLDGGEELEFYVAANGNDSWSGTRASPNKKGTDGPFATLERAQERVRQLIAGNLTEDVKVLIREGTHYVPDGLTFGPEDSGTVEYSITYAAYPGEEALLVGGTRLTDWREHSGDIWEANIPQDAGPLQLFENGWRTEVARVPKTGYLKIQGPVSGEERSAFSYGSGHLDPEDWDISDATVFIWPGHDWFSHEKPLSEIDQERRIIRMGSDSGYPMISGNRYFIRNVLSLLTAPGECQIDRSGGKVYCWPSAEPFENQTMVISTAPNLIEVRGSGTQIVRNLHFENLDLSISNGNVVNINGAENCSVKFCRIENGAANGVLIHGHAQGILVHANLIRYNGHHGVSLSGLPPGRPDVNHHNVIEDNHIHHCGVLQGHGYGVRIYQSGDNKIIHNHIHHMPRYGTTIKGLRYQVLREQVEGVTWENHWDYLHSRGNLIAYNHIHHVNLDSQDTGAMESWGPGRDNVYDHNLIHDVGNHELTLQSGIYLDDATDYFTVTNNIIYGVVGAGGDQCIFAKGIGNVIENNILVVGRENVAAIRNMEMGGERGDSHEYVRNILYFESEGSDVYGFVNWNDTRVAVSDYNIFWKPGGTLTMGGGPVEGPLDNWLALFGGKFDQHSLITDPLFVDPVARDYRLKPGSPALELGFNDIDMSQVGIREDFPIRLKEGWDELYRIPPRLMWRES